MKKVVAFDFDGVFHKHVERPNSEEDVERKLRPQVRKDGTVVEGKRKTLSGRDISIDNYEKPTMWYKSNLDLVKDYHKKGYDIYIVTARRKINDSQSKIRSWIDEQGITEDMIPSDHILLDQNSKAESIKKLEPEAFYDDSPNHVVDVQRVRTMLPSNFKLYYVIPELNINIEIPKSLNLNEENSYEILFKFVDDVFASMNSSSLGGGRMKRKSKKNRKRIKSRKYRKSIM